MPHLETFVFEMQGSSRTVEVWTEEEMARELDISVNELYWCLEHGLVYFTQENGKYLFNYQSVNENRKRYPHL